MPKKQNDIAVLILSCDKYEDLWEGFLYQFRKYWKNCPYPIYIGSNTVKYKKDTQIKTILSGPEKNWATTCKSILKLIPEKYVMVFAEDCLINSKIDRNIIRECEKLLLKKKTHHIYFFPDMEEFRFFPRKDIFSEYIKNDPLTVHLMGFWKKTAFLQLIRDGESQWDFQGRASYRTLSSGKYYFLNKPLFSWIHLVGQGQWFSDSLLFCIKNNVPIQLKKRTVIKEVSLLKNPQDIIRFIGMFIPWWLRIKIAYYTRSHLRKPINHD